MDTSEAKLGRCFFLLGCFIMIEFASLVYYAVLCLIMYVRFTRRDDPITAMTVTFL